jgi:hypothetical protein
VSAGPQQAVAEPAVSGSCYHWCTVTDRAEHDPRRRRATPHRWAGWLLRLVLAFMFSFGMLGSAGRPLARAAQEPEIEIGEVDKAFARKSEDVRIVRRTTSHGRGTTVLVLGRWQAPRRLDPTVRAPTPSRWQRPRRAPPPDEDGPSIG